MRNAPRDPREPLAMAFRSDDQDDRWSRPGDRLQQHQEPAHSDAVDSLSLHDTLRELAITVAGFVGAILLIIAAVSAFHA
jgi:hypothetical protein